MELEVTLESVEIDETKLSEVLTPRLVRVHSRLQRKIAVSAARRAPRRTGELKASIRPDGQEVAPLFVSGKVTAHARHAVFIHEGTRPHLIHARGKGPMVFKSKGRLRFAYVVRHPGNKGNPFLLRAAEIEAASI